MILDFLGFETLNTYAPEGRSPGFWGFSLITPSGIAD
jgi:hypothetical protein